MADVVDIVSGWPLWRIQQERREREYQDEVRSLMRTFDNLERITAREPLRLVTVDQDHSTGLERS